MTRLRVVAYNLYFGGADRVDAIHAVLAHTQPDLVALTEADDPRVVAELADRLGVHHVWAEGSGQRHIATLSRFPIVKWDIHRTPPLTQAALETTIEVPGCKGPSPPPSPEVGRSTSGEGGRGGEAKQLLTLYNVHFLPYLLLPFEVRRWQAVGKLLELIHARPPGPHLILGDLNAIAPGDRVLQRNNPPRMQRVMWLQLKLIFRLAVPRLLKAGYVDCFRRLHPDADGFTWMPGNRTTRYDYVFADPTLAPSLRTCRIVDDVEAVNVASDHFPLLAEFELNPPQPDTST